MRKTDFAICDQQKLQMGLISAFVVCSLDSIIPLLAIDVISTP